jgi:hypothetical protein
MNKNYHIPIPSLLPTPEEYSWAEENIMPAIRAEAEKFFEQNGPKFDKVNIDQKLFENWPLANRIKAHLSELDVELRRFCVFVGAAGFGANASPHVDAWATDIPMISRLNVPLFGYTGAVLMWWDTDSTDPRIEERKFHLRDPVTGKTYNAFSYLSKSGQTWEAPAFSVTDPGPCWNHVNLCHKLTLEGTTEMRVNVTAELKTQIPWDELVKRLESKGYC